MEKRYTKMEKIIENKEKNIISLALLKLHKKVKISHISGDPKIVQRLSDLGLTPQSEIILIRKTHKNGPLQIIIRRTTIAIAREIANTVFVNIKDY